jgi:hypothetical protein
MTAQADHLVNILPAQLGRFENMLNVLQGLFEEIHVDLLKFRSRQNLHEIASILNALDFEAGALLSAQFPLRLLHPRVQPVYGPRILADVFPSVAHVPCGKVFDDTIVESFTADQRVTSGSKGLENTIIDPKEGHL